jgi:hypothetical protein
LLPRLVASILSRETAQNLTGSKRYSLPNFPRGRQCRRPLAAALGRDDFESGSDSKSGWFEATLISQFPARCAAVVAACALGFLGVVLFRLWVAASFFWRCIFLQLFAVQAALGAIPIECAVLIRQAEFEIPYPALLSP